MSYELTGRIKLINNVQTFGSGFTKREFVVAVEDGKFPQEIALECIKDKTQLLDNFEPGQMVTVTFDIRGREYNGRYFNNLQAWRIEAAEDAAPNAYGDHPSPQADLNPDDEAPF